MYLTASASSGLNVELEPGMTRAETEAKTCQWSKHETVQQNNKINEIQYITEQCIHQLQPPIGWMLRANTVTVKVYLT